MTLRQTVNPNYGIGATRGWCLQYVDDAISAPNRTYSAQAAYEAAKARGWVKANTDMPCGLWSVLFWSIDNGEYAGLGHVALVYVNNQGQMAIHDSEVHAGARQPYGSLQELANWFGSAGTQLTFLGWSIGVDGRQIIEDYTPPQSVSTVEKPKTKTKKETENNFTEEIEMYLIECIDSKRWYVSTGVDVRYIKTTRMLGNYGNQFGKLNLRVDKMYQKELDIEFGTNATDPKRDISK